MDPCYEFDAPLYIDFERVRDGTESEGVTPVDHWFSSKNIAKQTHELATLYTLK